MILITGGAGFIGSHLVHRLVNDGHRVRILDLLWDTPEDPSSRQIANLAHFPVGVEFIRGDVRDPLAVRQAMTGVTTAFHLAALAGVHASTINPAPYYDVNVVGTERVLEAATFAKVHQVIFASSSSVYGNAPTPTPESTPTKPESPYAHSKILAEQRVRDWATSHGNATIIRPFTVYGPGQRPNMAVSRFMNALRNGQPIPIFGDGTITRDNTHVHDVVDALRILLKHPAPFSTFNVGSGTSVSLLELGEEVGRALGLKPMFEFHPPQPGDAQHTQADLAHIQRELHWKPKYSLREGLRHTLKASQ